MYIVQKVVGFGCICVKRPIEKTYVLYFDIDSDEYMVGTVLNA